MKQITLLILIAIITLPIFAQAQFNKYPIPYRKGDKWGYCDEDKNIIVEPIYDLSKPVVMYDPYKEENRYGEIRKGNRVGLVNHKGEIIINTKYTSIRTSYYFEDKNNLTNPEYFFVVSDENGKFGIVSHTVLDKVVVPLEYDKIITHSTIEVLGYKNGKGYSINPLTGEKSLFEEDEEEGEEVFFTPYNSNASRTSKKSKNYDLTTDDKSRFEEKHTTFFSEIKGKPFRQKRLKKENYQRNEKSYFKIVKDGKFGIVERQELNKATLENFISPQYDEIIDAKLIDPHFYKEDYFVVKKDGKVGVISYKNEVVVPFEYDAITGWNRYFAVYIVKDGKKGYLDFRSNFKIEPIYENIEFKSNYLKGYELFEVTKNGKKGYINRFGVEYFEN